MKNNQNIQNPTPVEQEKVPASIAPTFLKIPVGVMKSVEVTDLMDAVSDCDGVPDMTRLGRDAIVMIALTLQAGLCGRDGIVGQDRGGDAMDLRAIKRWLLPDLSVAEVRDAVEDLISAGLLSRDDGGALCVAVWDAWSCPTRQGFRDREAAEKERKDKNREAQRSYDAVWASATPAEQEAVDGKFRQLWDQYPGSTGNYENCRSFLWSVCSDPSSHGILDASGQPERRPLQATLWACDAMLYMISQPGSPISRTRAQGQTGVRSLREAIRGRVWMQAGDQ